MEYDCECHVSECSIRTGMAFEDAYNSKSLPVHWLGTFVISTHYPSVLCFPLWSVFEIGSYIMQ